MATQAEDELVSQAFQADKHDELARAIEKLTPEEAAFFIEKLEAAVKKRKIQLFGYLVAMLVWLLGMVAALVVYGISTGFVGWVFLVPFGFVGVTLWAFGRWADKVGRKAAPGLPPKPAQRS